MRRRPLGAPLDRATQLGHAAAERRIQHVPLDTLPRRPRPHRDGGRRPADRLLPLPVVGRGVPQVPVADWVQVAEQSGWAGAGALPGGGARRPVVPRRRLRRRGRPSRGRAASATSATCSSSPAPRGGDRVRRPSPEHTAEVPADARAPAVDVDLPATGRRDPRASRWRASGSSTSASESPGRSPAEDARRPGRRGDQGPCAARHLLGRHAHGSRHQSWQAEHLAQPQGSTGRAVLDG